MKLLRVHVIAAQTCGGLLDGMDIRLRPADVDYFKFDPLCLIGPNGSGKSQFLQVLAEIFQAVCHACVPAEERLEGNAALLFEVEYLIRPDGADAPVHVRASRKKGGKGKSPVQIEKREGNSWVVCSTTDDATLRLLPTKVVGYTSGDNETLSLPFLVSRSGYADDVRTAALADGPADKGISDTRLMLVDYSTSLEVLAANLLLSNEARRKALLEEANVLDIHSCRCIVQLAHSAVPRAPAKRRKRSSRKGVQLTAELEGYIEALKGCSTCYLYEDKTETYTFDFYINDQSRSAFAFFWASALSLYASLHKLAMLNDLAIPKRTRDRFRKDTLARRFASRLPEPQDEDKVFRFEQVRFRPRGRNDAVDYVSLSDGEHQLAQWLGTLAMQSFSNVLFLLDEPESHFNPQWRVKAVSRMLDLPTANGRRSDGGKRSQVGEQECLLTTHAPFVPSDMSRDRVFIFSKVNGQIKITHPDVETYGSTFDSILEACFGVVPPISEKSRNEIDDLRKSDDPEAIEQALPKLGSSVQKAFLRDRLRQLRSNSGER
jgi:restriction system-associated AAA family ATPase